MMRQKVSVLAAAALAACLAAPLQAAEPAEAQWQAEPIRWVLDERGTVTQAGADREAMLLQLASIARYNEIAVSITAADPDQAFALAEGLQARGVPAESIGIALRSGPGADSVRTEVLLDVLEVGAAAPRLQWAGGEAR